MEDKGFTVENIGIYIKVYEEDGWLLATISKETTKTFGTINKAFQELEDDLRGYVLQKVMELSFTELEDREYVEERNIYKLKGFEDRYLNKCITKTGIVYDVLPNKEEITESGTEYRTLFTDMEFVDMPKEVRRHNWEKIKGE